ncbi:hypothetical protein E1B28_002089 [Marasmius oreades]|uniref:Uncharacterized protein n=1 Tax=Marasmius oreades TaxID=181124 RepID=A0A9P7RMD7_9AGAR|nr:uncharacterized protein E1B28_002089 [Marasmius oreades]KAG7086130.1 hypothetical protein E1B28_002089 [Marasmius oreades]
MKLTIPSLILISLSFSYLSLAQNCQCGDNTYTEDDIVAAEKQAIKLGEAGKMLGDYPKKLSGREVNALSPPSIQVRSEKASKLMTFVALQDLKLRDVCGKGHPLYSFPLRANGVYDGTGKTGDRIVLSGLEKDDSYCGCIMNEPYGYGEDYRQCKYVVG